jgi:hypothetical protein
MPGSAAWHCRVTAPFIGAVAAFAPMFSLVSSDQLEGPAKESFGVSQPLFCLTDRRSQIFAAHWYSQRTNFRELLTIPLYVFGDDRQSCSNRVVHGVSLARLVDNRASLVDGAVGIVASLCIR